MILAGAVVLMTGLFLPTPAQASTYSPGTSRAYAPTYNAYTGRWDYHCSYAGWRPGAPVIWHCDLRNRYMSEYNVGLMIVDVLKVPNTGQWTPSPASHTTATYSYPMMSGEGQYCTVAWALSVDGGTNHTYACN